MREDLFAMTTYPICNYGQLDSSRLLVSPFCNIMLVVQTHYPFQ